MPVQTEAERKAAAQKAAATRKRNEAKRSQSARKAAATRARAQANVVKAAGYEAQRAVDTSIGAAITARDRVADAAKPLTSSQERKRKVRELRDSAGTTVRKAERRGASARKRAVRTVEREAKRVRRTVTDRVREASDRVGDLKERMEPDGTGTRS